MFGGTRGRRTRNEKEGEMYLQRRGKEQEPVTRGGKPPARRAPGAKKQRMLLRSQRMLKGKKVLDKRETGTSCPVDCVGKKNTLHLNDRTKNDHQRKRTTTKRGGEKNGRRDVSLCLFLGEGGEKGRKNSMKGKLSDRKGEDICCEALRKCWRSEGKGDTSARGEFLSSPAVGASGIRKEDSQAQKRGEGTEIGNKRRFASCRKRKQSQKRE